MVFSLLKRLLIDFLIALKQFLLTTTKKERVRVERVRELLQHDLLEQELKLVDVGIGSYEYMGVRFVDNSSAWQPIPGDFVIKLSFKSKINLLKIINDAYNVLDKEFPKSTYCDEVQYFHCCIENIIINLEEKKVTIKGHWE